MRVIAALLLMLIGTTLVASPPAGAQTQQTLTLEAAMTSAVDRHPSVVAASRAVQAAEARLVQARAGTSPQVSLTGRASVGTLGSTMAYDLLLDARARHGIVPVSYDDDVHPYTDLLGGRLDGVLLDHVIAQRATRRLDDAAVGIEQYDRRKRVDAEAIDDEVADAFGCRERPANAVLRQIGSDLVNRRPLLVIHPQDLEPARAEPRVRVLRVRNLRAARRAPRSPEIQQQILPAEIGQGA